MLSRRQSSTLPRGGKLNSLDRFTPLGLGTKPVETSKAYPAPNGYRVARPRRGEGSVLGERCVGAYGFVTAVVHNSKG